MNKIRINQKELNNYSDNINIIIDLYNEISASGIIVKSYSYQPQEAGFYGGLYGGKIPKARNFLKKCFRQDIKKETWDYNKKLIENTIIEFKEYKKILFTIKNPLKKLIQKGDGKKMIGIKGEKNE